MNFDHKPQTMLLIDEQTLQKIAKQIVNETCAHMQSIMSKSATIDGYISRKTASELLEVDEATIWRLAQKGKLKTYHIDGSSIARYKREDIDKLFEEICNNN